MCGIVAALRLEEASDWDDRDVEDTVVAGLTRIDHRGPDGQGIWTDPGQRCVLGHCRLSINDLSPAGSQPLHSPSKQTHAIVNGELYDQNDELRKSLSSDGYTFTGHSDSELVLALYERHGLNFLSYLRGEFALCLYDVQRDIFVAARDSYGIKPLFWRRQAGVVHFAAEIKGFLGDSSRSKAGSSKNGWQPEWDVQAIIDGGWGQDTRTVFKGVQKLRPGHYMVSQAGAEPEDQMDPRSEEDMVSEVRRHLIEAVRIRLRADVPVGIYLSGGIDSSALAGIASHLVKTEGLAMGTGAEADRVCCFSIAFDESSGFNESDVAERTAAFLGVKYIKKHMDEAALADHLAEATYHIEHHNHDLNYVGKYCLSDAPRQHGYKVVLTGEGADEQFGGYPLYLPDFLRGEVAASGNEDLFNMVPAHEGAVRRGYDMIGANTTAFDDLNQGAVLALTTTACLTAFTAPADLYTHPGKCAPTDAIALNIPPAVAASMSTWHPLNAAMYVWSKGHLANQFLSCLGDRVEMAHSVEARTPFLDHHLTNYVNGLPARMKIRPVKSRLLDPKLDGKNWKAENEVYIEKYALREAVKPFVTKEVYARRKHPYSAPTTYPPNGPIHRKLQQLLTSENVCKLGFVNNEHVQRSLEAAFDVGAVDLGKRTLAFRQALVVAQWVVLSQRFGIKTAIPPGARS